MKDSEIPPGSFFWAQKMLHIRQQLSLMGKWSTILWPPECRGVNVQYLESQECEPADEAPLNAAFCFNEVTSGVADEHHDEWNVSSDALEVSEHDRAVRQSHQSPAPGLWLEAGLRTKPHNKPCQCIYCNRDYKD